MTDRPYLMALGLMSGTSLDGVDAAIIRTDGEQVSFSGPSISLHYDEFFRRRLRDLLGRLPGPGDDSVVRNLTLKHVEAVRTLLDEVGLLRQNIDVIGFHGQTVFHDPSAGISCQIGDGRVLAAETGIRVVNDFRARDVAAGGEGAPLTPLYHAALARELDKPLVVLNIGGVANVTWIGEGGDILAFDTGPGNALIDDWTAAAIGRPMDEGGRLAKGGKVNQDCLKIYMEHNYFQRKPPKSLDREDFDLEAAKGLSAADGAATLTAFTAACIARAREHFPTAPKRWLVCGGGRHNGTLMSALTEILQTSVAPVETVGWEGDVLEAQAFAFLAVRSLYGLPLSLPSTTGVSAPMTGGVLHQPA
ncbi:MAG: anhydro-N-acetylmuramic acid kinase [Rhodospirillales bacterium]|nr:anhydro-N-acetylmuramic acid kinase [Rhodospirillales bacterium]